MKNNTEIIVELAKPERIYSKVYHDFLNSNLLTGEEKIIFIILKSFLDFRMDKNGTNGQVYPTIQTICNMTSWRNQKVIKVIKNLITKNVVKKIQRGLNKPNLYILADYATIWTCDNTENVAKVVENGGTKPLTPEQHIAELEKMGYTVEIKEKEPVSVHTTVTETSSHNNQSINNNNTDTAKSQEEIKERYPLTFLKTSLHYSDMLIQNPNDQNMIDTFFHYLHDTMNTKKKTIRVHGEDKPKETVISVLAKLKYYDFLYAVEKYKENTSKVEHQGAYIVTLLYNAKAQNEADITNRVRHDMYEYVNSPEYCPPCSGTAPEKNRF